MSSILTSSLKHHSHKVAYLVTTAILYKSRHALKVMDVISYTAGLGADLWNPARMLGEPKDPVRILMGLLFKHDSAGKAKKQVLLLLLLGVARTTVMHQSSRVIYDLTRAVHQRKPANFRALLLRSGLIAVAGSAITSLFAHARDTLALEWRHSLTRLLHSLYFDAINYYGVLNLQGRARVVDADERITREVYSVTKRLAIIVSLFARALPHVTWFTYLLWKRRGLRTALFPHIYLALAYEIAQRIFPKDLGLRFRALSASLSGYSRTASRLKVHGESVAALQGDGVERSLLQRAFDAVEAAQRSVSNGQSHFGLTFKFFYVYGSRSWITSFIMLPIVSARTAASSVSAEVSSIRNSLSLLLEMLIANGEILTMHAQARHTWGMAGRITKMMAALSGLSKVQNEVESSEEIAFEHVDISTPTGHLLTKDLSFSVSPKKGKLLLTGVNGAGKSSTFRCLGGLWAANGKIRKPSGSSDVFYLPQKPYNVVGTLKDQLCYPAEAAELDSSQVAQLLERVDLGHLVSRMNERDVDWNEQLSLGEMQRFSIARLLYVKPSFAIIDESTSACGKLIEKLLYSECDRLGISYITICHRPALEKFHTHRLHLIGNGEWEMRDLEDVEIEHMPVADASSSSTTHNSAPHIGAAKKIESPVRSRSALSKISTLAKILLPTTMQQVGLLCGVLGVRTLLGHLNGKVVAGLFRAAAQRDMRTFWALTAVNAGQDLVTALVDESVVLVGARLSESWHRQLAERTTELLFRNRAYYNITSSVPDWDERLSAEVAATAANLSQLMSSAITPAADALFFSSQLYRIVGGANVALLGAYVGSVAAVTRAVMPDHMRLSTLERQLESRFRGVHSRVVQHAESIAFFDGGAKEKSIADAKLDELIEHQHSVRASTARSNFVSWAISRDYTSYSSYVCAPELLSLWLQMGASDINNTYYVGAAVDKSLSAFGKLNTVAEALVALLGSSERVFQLMDSLEAEGGPKEDNVVIGSTIKMKDVDIVVPSTGMVLARNLSFEMPQGESLIVTGPNSTGKSSVFRVLAGLWPSNGFVQRPSDLFLVPQRVYSVPGDLASQVTYPRAYEKSNEAAVLESLRKAGIEYLATRFEEGLATVKRWEDTLSLGEQQRIGFARVFFRKPSACVVDESSDAISQEAEAALFQTLKELDVSCMTISKRLELPEFHSQQLALGASNQDKWVLTRL